MHDDDFLPISALQHYAYCPRQFALIHVEQTWTENYLTAEGRILHEQVDNGLLEKRRSIRYERGVMLISKKFQITGRLDLLEIVGGDIPSYVPVEYKRGTSKLEDWDRIQLCAQAICIEEMCQTAVLEGSIWYFKSRRREKVSINDHLREKTIALIEGARALFKRGTTVPPTTKTSLCKACSLSDVCLPSAIRNDRTAKYTRDIFEIQNASFDFEGQ